MLNLILVLSLTSLGVIISGCFVAPLTLIDIIFKSLIAIINIGTIITCIYCVGGRGEVISLFIDKILGLDNFKELKEKL